MIFVVFCYSRIDFCWKKNNRKTSMNVTRRVGRRHLQHGTWQFWRRGGRGAFFSQAALIGWTLPPSISRLDSAFWFTGHILMHCSAVLSAFDIYYRLDNMFENPWIIFILTIFHSRPPHHHILFTPVSLCQRLLFAHRLRRSSHQTAAHLSIAAGWKRIFGLAVHISISAVPFGFVKTARSTISDGIGPAEEKKDALFQGLCSLAHVKSWTTLDFPSLLCTGVLPGFNLYLTQCNVRLLSSITGKRIPLFGSKTEVSSVVRGQKSGQWEGDQSK